MELKYIAALFYVVLQIYIAESSSHGTSEKPYFIASIQNITIAQGRNARFVCAVENLGIKKVAWLYLQKTGVRTILAAGSKVVTQNPRVSVGREGTSWILNFHNVSKRDEGQYMCQINTLMPTTQEGHLKVVVSPVIEDSSSSDDIIVDQNSDVSLKCDATGDPVPQIEWMTEGGTKIGTGRILMLRKVQWTDAGAYLCVASNGVPPAVAKRMVLNINFSPIMTNDSIESQKIGSVIGDNVSLPCLYAARPEAKVQWLKNAEIFYSKSQISTVPLEKDSNLWASDLHLPVVKSSDFGVYECIVSNRLGSNRTSISLFEVMTTSTTVSPTTAKAFTNQGTSLTSSLSTNSRKIPSEIDASQPPYFPFWNNEETTTAESENGNRDPFHFVDKNIQRQSHVASNSIFGTKLHLRQWWADPFHFVDKNIQRQSHVASNSIFGQSSSNYQASTISKEININLRDLITILIILFVKLFYQNVS